MSSKVICSKGEYIVKKTLVLLLVAWLAVAGVARAAQLNKVAAVVNGAGHHHV